MKKPRNAGLFSRYDSPMRVNNSNIELSESSTGIQRARSLIERLLFIFGCTLLFACSDSTGVQDNETSAPLAEALPDLPIVATEQLAPAVKEQFDQLQAKLQAEPRNGRHNEAYARLLHAYSLHAPANIMYQRCIQLRPADLHCIYLKALNHKELGDESAAIDLLESLLARSPRYPRAKTVLADSYRKIGLNDKALIIYQQLSASKSLSMEESYGQALSLLEQGEVDAARTQLEGMLNEQPYGSVHAALANVHRALANQEKVQRHLQLAAAYQDEKLPFVDAQLSKVQELQIGPMRYLREGAAHYRSGRYQEAVSSYLKALENDANNGSAHANLVGLYGELGQISNARKHYTDAVRLNPANVLTYSNMGTVLLKRGEFAEAGEQFAQVLELQPHHGEARTLKNYSLALQGLPADPEEYKRAIQDNPDYALAYYLLGRDLAKTDCTLALPKLERSVAQETASSTAYYTDLARCYHDLKRTEDATRALTTGIRLAEKYRNRASYQAMIELRNSWSTPTSDPK